MAAAERTSYVHHSPPAWQPQVQVKEGHYTPAYDDWDTWIRYYWAIHNVVDRKLDKLTAVEHVIAR